MGIITKKLGGGESAVTYNAADETETQAISGGWKIKLTVSITEPGTYIIWWQSEIHTTSGGRCQTRLYCTTNTTEYGYSETYQPQYEIHSGFIIVNVPSTYQFEIQYKYDVNTCFIRRARIYARRSV